MKKLDVTKLLEVILAFNSEKNYFDLLVIILTKMMEITGADAGTLYISEDNKLFFRIMRNISLNVFETGEINLPPIVLDENNINNISAYAALKNEVISIDDVYSDDRFNFSGPKDYDKITGYRTKSMLVFPLTTFERKHGGNDSGVIGVIQLMNAINPQTGEAESFEDFLKIPILPALANISASALANVLYAEELKRLFNSFIAVMTGAIDERSPYTKNHTSNVAAYCDSFVKFLRRKFPEGHEYYFDERRREQLIVAATLHDVGKIITPSEIMDKPDRLGMAANDVKYKFQLKACQTENLFLAGKITRDEYDQMTADLKNAEELIEKTNTSGFLKDEDIARVKALSAITYTDFTGETVPLLSDYEMDALTIRSGTLTQTEREIMQEHVSVTARLLAKMAFNKYYEDVPLWARSHHEYKDGTGYPSGISDNEVTTEMSILAMVDIFDALTANDRPYKKAVSQDKAFGILIRMAEEGKFQKDMVELFVDSKAEK